MDRTPLRDFLEIPYDKLEEMNLAAKQQRLWPRARRPDPRGAAEVPEGREAHQGGDRLLHRPRGPLPHAGLRQEVPARVGRQPHLRRVVDPRLLAAGRVRPAPGRRLDRRSTGCRPTSSARARCWSSGSSRSATARPYHADMRTRLKAYTEALFERDGTIAHASNEIEGFLFKGRDAERQYHRHQPVRVPLDRRLLPLAAGRRAAAVHRRVGGSAARAGLRQREGPPGGGAVAVRDELLVHRGVRRGRPGAALQADLPPGGAADGHDGVVPAEAGDRRQRQRHAHQPVADARRLQPVLGPERARTTCRRSAGPSSTACWPTPTTSA